MPPGVLVPDLVIAFTWMPLDRPCDASNRFETNSNSPIASRLYRGWPKLSATWLVTCWPSRLSWNVMFELRRADGRFRHGVRPAARREQRQVHPVAAVDRQFLHLPRIDVGRSRLEFVVSTSGASPVTVTDSCTVDGAIWRFTTAVWSDQQLRRRA